jgi:hypothetical protein
MTAMFPGSEHIPPWTSGFVRLMRDAKTVRNRSHLSIVYGTDEVG